MRGIWRLVAHAIGMAPLVAGAYQVWRMGWPIDPVAAYMVQSGDVALVLLVLSLLITPLANVCKSPRLGVMRRPLGLYAFAYVLIHVGVYVGLDYAWDWRQIVANVRGKRYLIAGVVAAVCLVPLALTSTTAWQRRLGIWWKRVHRIVYVAAIASVLHYWWVVKSDIRLPLVAGIIVTVLLGARLRWRWSRS